MIPPFILKCLAIFHRIKRHDCELCVKRWTEQPIERERGWGREGVQKWIANRAIDKYACRRKTYEAFNGIISLSALESARGERKLQIQACMIYLHARHCQLGIQKQQPDMVYDSCYHAAAAVAFLFFPYRHIGTLSYLSAISIALNSPPLPLYFFCFLLVKFIITHFLEYICFVPFFVMLFYFHLTMCVQINLKIMKKLQDYDSQKSSYHIMHKQVIPRDSNSSSSSFFFTCTRETKGDEKMSGRWRTNVECISNT